MAWIVSPNPEQFDEAIAWFSRRVVMTGDFAVDLDAKARSEAFWIGTGLQIQEVDAVFHAIDQAIKNGESFEDFRKNLTVSLNEGHAETVFRNATQRAYNAGRWEQLRDPEMLRARPYWMFDAVLDGATTAICKDAHGTVLPAKHPWWESNVPPRHHRCRSSIRSLTKTNAEKRGISKDGPTEAAEGFGAAPSPKDVEKLKPDPKVDPKIIEITKAKEKKPRKKKPVPPPPKPGPAPKKPKKTAAPKPGPKPQAPKPEKTTPPLQKPPAQYDPEYWTEQYREQYGDAAGCVGWGRAMHERALDRPLSELLKQADALAEANHPLFVKDRTTPMGRVIASKTNGFREMLQVLDRPPGQTLRGSAWVARCDEERNFVASCLGQIEHSLSIKKGPGFTIQMGDGVANTHIKQTIGFYDSMLDASVSRPKGFKAYIGKLPDGSLNERDFCSPGYAHAPRGVYLTVFSEADTYIHEFAHAIEFDNARSLKRSVQFVQSRTKGERLQKLSDITGKVYRDDERARPDKFWNPYMGKEYLNEKGEHAGSEVLAMGVGQGMCGPDIYKQDPETMWFMLGQLAGR